MGIKIKSHSLYRAASVFAVLLSMAGFTVYSSDTVAAARAGMSLCADLIIPSLFPFFVISSLSVEIGLAEYAGIAFEGIMRRLFRLPGACAPAFTLGLIGGYPVGARTAIGIYQKKLCTKDEAERLLAFCNNSGPSFILGAVGAGIFGGSFAGILLYLSHVAASFIVGIIFRFYKCGKQAKKTSPCTFVNTSRLSEAFVESVKSSFLSILNICAFVIFFSVAIRMLYLMNIIPMAAALLGGILSPFGVTHAHAEGLITGFIEITSGLWSLSAASNSLSVRLAMAAFMLGWAGISVHCQVLAFLFRSDLSAWPYIIGKLLHAAVSAAIVFLFLKWFPLPVPVSASLVEGISAVTSLDFKSSFYLTTGWSFLFWIFISMPSFAVKCKKNWKTRGS